MLQNLELECFSFFYNTCRRLSLPRISGADPVSPKSAGNFSSDTYIFRLARKEDVARADGHRSSHLVVYTFLRWPRSVQLFHRLFPFPDAESVGKSSKLPPVPFLRSVQIFAEVFAILPLDRAIVL